MKSDYDKIKSTDVSTSVATLEKAETDWPAKKADLDARIESLKSAPAKAEKVWTDAQRRPRSQPGLPSAHDRRAMARFAAPPARTRTSSSPAQLYDSRDVILEHLDSPRPNDSDLRRQGQGHQHPLHGRRRINKSDTDTKQKTEQLPESRCEALKNDIGMEIEHKPAGAYETETQRVPQPPGFAYMAPPGQRNQYGYWEQHNGTSVWTWLPQYLMLREMLWNHQYVPIPSYEYEGYWSARRSGTTYYGQTYSGPNNTQVQSAPKYGTHGTFTSKSYAGSNYQNKGSYKSSGYANNPSAAPSRSGEQGHQFGKPSSSGTGKRFGSSSGSPRSAPRSAPSGRRFGKH